MTDKKNRKVIFGVALAEGLLVFFTVLVIYYEVYLHGIFPGKWLVTLAVLWFGFFIAIFEFYKKNRKL